MDDDVNIVEIFPIESVSGDFYKIKNPNNNTESIKIQIINALQYRKGDLPDTPSVGCLDLLNEMFFKDVSDVDDQISLIEKDLKNYVNESIKVMYEKIVIDGVTYFNLKFAFIGSNNSNQSLLINYDNKSSDFNIKKIM